MQTEDHRSGLVGSVVSGEGFPGSAYPAITEIWGDALSDPPGSSVPQLSAADRGDNGGRPRPEPGWRARLTSLLIGASGGMAINDLSGTLGYRGLAGIFAIIGVLITTDLLRGLDARARLRRHASLLFLTPAAAAAAIAAFESGRSAGILTVVAVVLTAGAVVLTTRLKAAAQLLSSAAGIGSGVAFIGVGVALIVARHVPLGVPFIGVGVAFIWAGVAFVGAGEAFIGVVVAPIVAGDLLFAAAVIGVTAALIGLGVAAIVAGDLLTGVAGMGFGLVFIAVVVALIVAGDLLLAMAGIGVGVAFLGVGVALIRATRGGDYWALGGVHRGRDGGHRHAACATRGGVHRGRGGGHRSSYGRVSHSPTGRRGD